VNRRPVLRRRIVVAVLLLLCVALLTAYFRESDSGVAHSVQSGVMTVVSPLQSGTATATKPFRDAWNWVGDLFTAKSQNKALRTEVQQLRAGLAQELTTQDENVQLRALLDYQRSKVFPAGAQMVTARVIDRSTSAWYSTATINAGSSDGVSVDDPVVAPSAGPAGEGLVGRVIQVTANASQVMLVTDQESFVDSMVEPGGAQGILGGSVTGDVTLNYVDKSEKVKVGQFVVTSGRNGSIFVKGIPIGRVESVGSQEVELYQSIAVKPSVDFRKLDIVAVITR
jgi:rod shape-determining protein MreC